MAKKANSNLLKEAIADARAVRETALKNAELAIQEALSPRLQSIISQKIQAEMEEEDDDVEVIEGDDVDAVDDTLDMEPEMDLEEDDELDLDSLEEEDDVDMEDDLTEEDGDDVTGATFDVTEDDDVELDFEDDDDEIDSDEMDLEEIIRELEDELEEEDDLDLDSLEEEDDELELDLEEDEDEELNLDLEEEDEFSDETESSDEIDLDEILREMGYGDDEEVTEEDEVEVDNTEELESELQEAYRTIGILKKTINEVNLLNAKLLYANKVFRQYNLTTEQKRKIVESFDRTGTVREVKLVFATISESMKLSGATKIKKITEGFASKPTKSTAPKGIIKEDVDFGMSEFQKRNKELAGIIKK